MMLADALVIGGGIAGGAVAAHLAQAGRKIILIERKAGPHDKVCGEFISSEGALYLCHLGIDLEDLGAVPISTVNVFAGPTSVSAHLPFAAFSISRQLLDETILITAAGRGTELHRGAAVRSLRPLEKGWIAELENGKKVSATEVFLATGKHDLRGWKRPAGRQNDFIGFKLNWRVQAARAKELASCVELFLFPGGYAGLNLVENRTLNLCLVIRRGHFAQLDNRWDLLLSMLRAEFLPLHQALAGAEPCSDRPLAIASIPYGLVQSCCDGLWRLGDQAAVIPSFSGDGISIALHSARLAAEYYLAGKTNSQFQCDLAAGVTKQVRTATLLSHLLVHPKCQAIAIAAARVVPSLVPRIAYRTRIPSRHLMRTSQQFEPTPARRRPAEDGSIVQKRAS